MMLPWQSSSPLARVMGALQSAVSLASPLARWDLLPVNGNMKLLNTAGAAARLLPQPFLPTGKAEW